MSGQIELSVSCVECKKSKKVRADIENERIVACVPAGWSPVYFDFNGVSVDLLFYKRCATKFAAKWGVK